MNSARILLLEHHAFQRTVALAALEALGYGLRATGYGHMLWANEGTSAS